MRYYEIEESCQVHGLEGLLQGVFGRTNTGMFVEVGAYDGRTYSNTYPLAKIGWNGLYIEPIQDFYLRCIGNHEKHPNIKVIREMVSDSAHPVEIYKIGETYTINPTFKDLSGAGLYSSMTTVTLDTILERQGITKIDLLVVDTEGEDLCVLDGFDILKYMPSMVIVEAHEFHEDPRLSWNAEGINAYMAVYDYRRIYADGINNVYICI